MINMKQAILEIMRSKTFNVQDQSGVDYIVIDESEFGYIATKINAKFLDNYFKHPPLNPETIEVISGLFIDELESAYFLTNRPKEKIKQAQAEFNKAYGGGE